MHLIPIDWQEPWLQDYIEASTCFAASDLFVALNAAAQARQLCNSAGLPIQFVPQAALPDGVAYETFIAATGQVPTRANWHDGFNALIWLHFPRIKAALNAIQAAQITHAGIGQTRGSVRDAATLLDENAAFYISCHPDHILALQGMHWSAALFSPRTLYGQQWQVRLFGHALLEKLLRPYKSITAHTLCIKVTPAYFSLTAEAQRNYLDHGLAAWLHQHTLSPRDFTPLPVLGVPGFCEGNQHIKYYQDSQVFRPPRAQMCRTVITLS